MDPLKITPSSIGKQAESYAAEYLGALGHTILFRNWRCRSGELDIITQDGESIVITEVKVRLKGSAFSAKGSVNRAKQRQLYAVAQQFCAAQKELVRGRSVRFDVVRISYELKDGGIIFFVHHLKRAIDHASASPDYQKKTVQWKSRARGQRSFRPLRKMVSRGGTKGQR